MAGPPRTPAKRTTSGGNPGSGTASTQKQRSLLSFFKPPASATSTLEPKKKVVREADKENCGKSQSKSVTPSEGEDKEQEEPELPTPKPAGSGVHGKGLGFLEIPVKSLSYRDPAALEDPSSPHGPNSGENTATPTNTRRRLRKVGSSYLGSSSPVKEAGYLPSSPTARVAAKRINYTEDSGDENDEPVLVGRGPKRRKAAIVDEDSSDEFQFDVSLADIDDEMEDFIVPDDEDENDVPTKKKSKPLSKTPSKGPEPKSTSKYVFRPKTNDSVATPVKTPAKNAISKMSTPSAISNYTPSRAGKLHEQRYPWLIDILDADKNPPGHPNYDPRTLYVPPYAWSKFSPFEKQYWEIKSKNWDTVVFFKKGKFYELLENDATIGHQEFDLKVTERVNMRMVGVPVTSFNTWATQFIAKGYKVGRVEQFETALGKEMREKESKGKEEKVIRRELACILTGGTLVDEMMLQDEMSIYCVAIKESENGEGLPCFGICFVDTATGSFSMTEFVDDLDMSKFETFVAQIRPKELVLEKNGISTKATRILKNNTSIATIWNKLKPGKEFLEANTTIREIIAGKYFSEDDPEDMDKWPQAIREAKGKDLVLSALGALLNYMQTLMIDKDLVSMGVFNWYDPIRKTTSLVLDGQTLQNLEIFANTFDGSSAGTLFNLLNRCITAFGKRLFRQWLCHPLADADKINARLDAVEALLADDQFRETFILQLGKLPDLERLISRIHAGHCKAGDFLRVLEGFEQIRDAMNDLRQQGEGDGLIGRIIRSMPDLDEALKHWETAFDREKTRNEGVLVPERGVEADFDSSQDNIESIISELHSLLKQYQQDYKCRDICFKDVGKEIYLVEVPSKIKNIPKDWSQMSATQKVKRYWPPKIRKLVRSLQEAQETHSQIVKDIAGRFYKRFDQDYSCYLGAVRVVAELDCLISLSKASVALGEPACRPTFVEDERTVISFEELRHPCISQTIGEFIPNDIKLGGDSPNISLLTGANAAGKSTVLRMSCIAVIMAQIGCYVPCKSATLTPVDRIMSRLGANDNIFAAQSTFFVELSETKKILTEATSRSLVILDELGRGTSSYDGVAVAQSVLHHVATHIGCIGYFATHYHSLATEFVGHPEIQPRRMAIHVDDENRNITFLYKLEEGVAEGSFGMHCAAMCGINKKIIDRAEEAAKEFEHTSRLKESLEQAKSGATYIPLGIQSDFAWLVKVRGGKEDSSGCKEMDDKAINVLLRAVEAL